MARKPITVEIVEEGEERTLLTIYDDGTQARVPIVKTPKEKRATNRPYWYWELRTGRRKFF